MSRPTTPTNQKIGMTHEQRRELLVIELEKQIEHDFRHAGVPATATDINHLIATNPAYSEYKVLTAIQRHRALENANDIILENMTSVSTGELTASGRMRRGRGVLFSKARVAPAPVEEEDSEDDYSPAEHAALSEYGRALEAVNQLQPRRTTSNKDLIRNVNHRMVLARADLARARGQKLAVAHRRPRKGGVRHHRPTPRWRKLMRGLECDQLPDTDTSDDSSVELGETKREREDRLMREDRDRLMAQDIARQMEEQREERQRVIDEGNARLAATAAREDRDYRRVRNAVEAPLTDAERMDDAKIAQRNRKNKKAYAEDVDNSLYNDFTDFGSERDPWTGRGQCRSRQSVLGSDAPATLATLAASLTPVEREKFTDDYEELARRVGEETSAHRRNALNTKFNSMTDADFKKIKEDSKGQSFDWFKGKGRFHPREWFGRGRLGFDEPLVGSTRGW